MNAADFCMFGDCRDSMRQLIAESVKVQMCVTSPPYFGLRAYLPDSHPDKSLELGLEQTPQEYVSNMVEVFRLVRDLLADDGVLWLNLGDCYGKNKQLLGTPWKVAFALQDDAWVLRQEIIWSKKNCMPESVTDRCTKSHEQIFLFSKNPHYYFDHEAIKEQSITNDPRRPYGSKGSWDMDGRPEEQRHGGKLRAPANVKRGDFNGKTNNMPGRESFREFTETRNKRSVWEVATQPYSEAHFATFPPALIEPCILAGSRPGDIVLDPFLGSGTTAQVAQNLGRRWIGCELNNSNLYLQKARTRQQGFALEVV